MKKSIFLALLAVSLAGCATPLSNVESGNFSYVSNDVSVTPFGSNYKIQTILQAGNDRIIAKTFATECIDGQGDLQVEGSGVWNSKMYPVSKSGKSNLDQIFNRLCSKGLPAAMAMESRLSDSDRQRRDQAVQSYLAQPRTSKRIKVNTHDPQPKQPINVNCTTSNYSEGSYTNCRSQ